MILNTRISPLLGSLALIVSGTVLLAPPAQADAERLGACSRGTYDFSVDRDGGRFEVELSLDGVAPNSKWKVALRQDGKRFFKKVIRVDEDGDRDIVRFRGNTPGTDTFKFRAKQVNGSTVCKARIVVS
jgi:hypothetical protein